MKISRHGSGESGASCFLANFQEGMLMTKADLVEKIAVRGNLTKAAAERALNAFLASVEEALSQEAKLTLTGLGTFAVESRNARQGRNPRTGATLTIPACKMVKFRPGKMLKDALN
ncbi:HU family DNA-binding protein [uncultured Desulfovibrio sp.]|uniref:HU family DNA-binding protein n=1 Tax=uncultured Desulfovibrio sp. TaxID=167968 RepID=UPI0026353199|nr:HU family DNA-binding protein [uncultured Desulfovibrio sp.]